jgi:polyhydroxybutyrate depolymerase
MIHGMDDTTLPYDGGFGTHGATVKSVADAVAFWNAADGCTGSPLEHASPDFNIVVDDYKDCAPAGEVTLVTIANGGHQWPTPDDQTHFPASSAIWKFFSEHSRKDQ